MHDPSPTFCRSGFCVVSVRKNKKKMDKGKRSKDKDSSGQDLKHMPISSKMVVKYRNDSSWNGYQLDALKSALQKYIRRGMLDEALEVAGELDLFKHMPDRKGEAIRTNFLHRLAVIFVEDIGVAGLPIWAKVDKALTTVLREREKPPTDRDWCGEAQDIANVIGVLCACHKSRCASHSRAISDTSAASRKLAADKYPEVRKLHEEVDLKLRSRDIKAGHEDTEGDIRAYSKWFAEALTSKSWTAVWWARRLAESTAKVKVGKKTKPVYIVFNVLQQQCPDKFKGVLGLALSWFDGMLKTVKENFMCWLNIVNAILMDAPMNTMDGASALLPVKNVDAWAANRRGLDIRFPDYVLDRHTKTGRHKSLTTFAMEGAHVENESALVNPTHKQFYNDIKTILDQQNGNGPSTIPKKSSKKSHAEAEAEAAAKAEAEAEAAEAAKAKAKAKAKAEAEAEAEAAEAAKATKAKQKAIVKEKKKRPAETELWEFIVRAKLPEAASKSDVYFAKDTASGHYVVVKGPMEKSHAKAAVMVDEWKRENGLPSVGCKHEKAVVNRWPGGTPVGYRNRVLNKTGHFVVTTSLLRTQAFDFTVDVKSDLWPVPTTIMDWDRIRLHVNMVDAQLNDKGMVDFVRAVLARFLFGVEGQPERNFLLAHGGRVVSIGEDTAQASRDTTMMDTLKGVRCSIVYNWLRDKDNYNKLGVEDWIVPWQVVHIRSVHDRLKLIQHHRSCRELFQ